jgi:biopolymer transport protein ExbD
MIAIYEDGTLALNLNPQTDESLRDELTKRLRVKAKKSVFIDADKDSNYARVITIMDMARDCGAELVGFADMSDEGPAKMNAAVPGAVPVEGTPAPG